MAKNPGKKKDSKEETKTPEATSAEKAAAKPKKKPKLVEREGFRGIVRIAGKDIPGEMPLKRALLRVRGIGHTLSVAASKVLSSELKLAKDMQVGELTDEQIAAVDAVLFNINKYGVPQYLMNRNVDHSDGTSKHVIMNDLLFSLREDLETAKRMYSWKGYRAAYGQKVRGQRTRNTGRTGMAVGVLRKAIIAQQQAAKAGEAGGAGGGGAPAAAAAAPAGASGAAPKEAKKEEKK